MFVSVKERARQIANGQFSATPTSAPVASLIDLAPEPKLETVATAKKSSSKDAPAKAQASPSKTKSSKTAPTKEPTSKVAPPKATPPPTTVPKTAPPNPTVQKTTSPPEASTPKKSSSKTKASKEPSSKPSSKPSSPKIGSPKPTSSSKAGSQAKAPPTPKPTSPPKPAAAAKPPSPKTPTTPSKPKRSKSPPKRSKSPPKRVDSPISDTSTADPLSSLKSACLKQISSTTGLGGRRLSLVPKQRSSGLWYVALKDEGSDKYLKMWTHREKTFESPEEALEAYLVFAGRMRDGVRWFPVGAGKRAGSPGKGR